MRRARSCASPSVGYGVGEPYYEVGFSNVIVGGTDRVGLPDREVGRQDREVRPAVTTGSGGGDARAAPRDGLSARTPGQSLPMVIAASTLWTVVFIVGVIVLGLLAAGASRAPGDMAERGVTPLGAKLPESDEMVRPPEEGGPR